MKQLVLNSDDFGLCHSVNLGVVKGFTEGLLTQASIMVPAPWFEEAASLALQHAIPLGIHLTITCEWDNYRWRPLTSGKSLVNQNGGSFNTIEEARKKSDSAELEAEFVAQIELAMARGLQPHHIDVHLGMANAEVFARVCRRFNLPAILPSWLVKDDPELAEVCYPVASCLWLEGQTQDDWAFANVPFEKKKSLLKRYLQGMPDGVHYNACHLSVPGDEIACLDRNHHYWAETIRTSDLALVCDPEVNDLVDGLGIVKSSVRSLA
jgi:predicted glycoside hydrolase/deacetylase ChbG (UPF0249 family)